MQSIFLIQASPPVESFAARASISFTEEDAVKKKNELLIEGYSEINIHEITPSGGIRAIA